MNDEQGRDRTKISKPQITQSITILKENRWFGLAEDVKILLECYERESAENSAMRTIIEQNIPENLLDNEPDVVDQMIAAVSTQASPSPRID